MQINGTALSAPELRRTKPNIASLTDQKGSSRNSSMGSTGRPVGRDEGQQLEEEEESSYCQWKWFW